MITDTIFCSSLISLTFLYIHLLLVDYFAQQLQFFFRGPSFETFSLSNVSAGVDTHMLFLRGVMNVSVVGFQTFLGKRREQL